MEQIEILNEIAKDTLDGLMASPKFLQPKYFYDEKGSDIFREIMHMPEYYLTKCEMEIFEEQKLEICKYFRADNSPFDLIEFGSGDGIKTKLLLEHLLRNRISFRYLPIDISEHANSLLEKELKASLPNLSITTQTGDYFEVMQQLSKNTGRRKVLLFLGANIGNYSRSGVHDFYSQVATLLKAGDRILTGFDLKKSPRVIIDAYNDKHGYTRNFNLNHLARLNSELGADFNLNLFEQHTEYSPLSGAVRSYLVSTEEQVVAIDRLNRRFKFKKWEPIYMELSQKYDFEMITKLAEEHGFQLERNFTDHRLYFADSLWVRNEN